MEDPNPKLSEKSYPDPNPDKKEIVSEFGSTTL
jgi:hypothetical protein